jgi:D-3-phosphoglycerate dehydrogenase / 2-oxoglutarate reductase
MQHSSQGRFTTAAIAGVTMTTRDRPKILFSPQGVFSAGGPHAGLLREAGFDLQYPNDNRLALGQCTEDETIALLGDAAAVVAWGETYSKRVIDSLPKLRVISRAGVGFDRVDVAAATAAGVVVTITPNANHEAVAEQALALLLAVAKSIVRVDGQVRSGDWPSSAVLPLRGKTLGIVGLGRIGKSFASRAIGLRLKVLATDAAPDREFACEHGIEIVPLNTLLAESDFVSLHCPLSDATRGLIDRRALAHMKSGSILINTARGGIVVEDDLIEALRSGHLWGAGLDVLVTEPPAADNPLLSMPNVVFTPHNAGGDAQALEDMAIEAVQNIVSLHRGEWPAGAVITHELVANWQW